MFPGRLNFLSLQKMQPTKNRGGDPPNPPPTPPSPPRHGKWSLRVYYWRNYTRWKIGVWFFLFYQHIFCYCCSILIVAICGFCHFSDFSHFFLSWLWEGRDQGSGIITPSGYHLQQLNAVNEGQRNGGAMGIFYGDYDRSIGYTLFWTLPHLHRVVTMYLSQ